jgi:hypothetical protein
LSGRLSRLLFLAAQDHDEDHDSGNTDEDIQIERHVNLLSRAMGSVYYFIPQMTAKVDRKLVRTDRQTML